MFLSVLSIYTALLGQTATSTVVVKPQAPAYVSVDGDTSLSAPIERAALQVDIIQKLTAEKTDYLSVSAMELSVIEEKPTAEDIFKDNKKFCRFQIADERAAVNDYEILKGLIKVESMFAVCEKDIPFHLTMKFDGNSTIKQIDCYSDEELTAKDLFQILPFGISLVQLPEAKDAPSFNAGPGEYINPITDPRDLNELKDYIDNMEVYHRDVNGEYYRRQLGPNSHLEIRIERNPWPFSDPCLDHRFHRRYK